MSQSESSADSDWSSGWSSSSSDPLVSPLLLGSVLAVIPGQDSVLSGVPTVWGQAPSRLSDVEAVSAESLISVGGHAEWSEGSMSSKSVPVSVLRGESVVSLSGDSDRSGSSIPEELSSPVVGSGQLGDVRSVGDVSVV